jgi:phospholipase C
MDRKELLRLDRLTRGLDRATRTKLIEDAELEELRDPEGALRRRDFLRRSAYTAGLATAATLLPTELILKEAARNQAFAAMPTPSNMEIDHFVVLMMENRSFDHYFGWHTGANAVQSRSYPDPQNGNTPVATRHASTLDAQWQGCGHPDPDHSWDGGRAQLGSSSPGSSTEPDGFLEGDNDEFALCYYNEDEVEFIHAAAKEFTLYDKFHCSLMASTWPNRYYMWSASSGGRKNNDPPVQTGGNQWNTIFDRAQTKTLSDPTNPVTARYFPSDLPFSAVWGPRGVPWTGSMPEYYARCASGTLPSISFVDPPFRDGGGGDGLSADEHPLGDIRLGQAFMADVVNAFIESPCWERGALFIVYDEWGGFFDHAPTQSVADDRQDTSNINSDFGLMGYRIPAVAISPYAGRGAVSGTLHGFESILKLIGYRFGFADLCMRDANANNIGDSFTNWTTPDFTRPSLPDPNHIVSKPCTLGGGDIDDNADSHASDLAALEELADRFGFETGSGKADEIFRAPDSVKQSLVK